MFIFLVYIWLHGSYHVLPLVISGNMNMSYMVVSMLNDVGGILRGSCPLQRENFCVVGLYFIKENDLKLSPA